ncbi:MULTISPECIES: ABC transporter substrate-binding protein [unclassified Chelatococcus]|uniref:ABC transporter substrate-binding protein n=1 Tax=unclassified Chelatococcus TaxID=2638111 RepID=UPI0002D60435|nr:MULTISPECIES: extracellular solute-binding protein [unclassified Chelatococcus]ALA20129.1 ABC transporter substrate-binding protein [Chelatococcus sp. CO-6]
MFRVLAVCLAAVFVHLALPATAAGPDARPVRVLTSFPPQFLEPYRRAFEERNPGSTIEFVQRKTTAAVAGIVGGRQRADVFWASAPDAFEILKAAGRLARLKPRPTGAPERIAGYPVNDPDGAYLGFALSGYGFVYNPDYLAEKGLPVPRAWSDLAAPIYAGHIGISAPSRSGTMHLMVEAILQVYGWERGWGLWSEIGGNLATVTARSFGVSAGVAGGRFGVGPSIDFLANQDSLPRGSTAFALPEETLFVPASIAVLRDADNREGAERFVDLVLSPEGQAILLEPAIARLPISPAAYPAGETAPDSPFRREGLFAHGLFDPRLSAARYELVNIIFDEMITFRRAELARLWRSVRTVEAALVRRGDAEAARLVGEARDALTRPPVGADEAMDLERWRTLERVRRGVPAPEPQARLEARIKAAIDDNLRRAARAVAEAAARLDRRAAGGGVSGAEALPR